jgi:signal transduction histidine kinase
LTSMPAAMGIEGMTAPSVTSEFTLPRREGPSESRATRWVAWLLLGGLGLVLWFGRVDIQTAVAVHWLDLLFWMGLLVVVNLLPVETHHLTLTLDVPITLAVAFLYEPAVAALLAGVAAFDTRELRRQISASRATFNRVQIATSVYLASAVFHSIAPSLNHWHVVLAATVAALLTDYASNSLLVMLFERINSGSAFSATLRQLKVGRASEFLLTYLGYGVLALAVARLFAHEGVWAVAVFLIPILVARQLLLRNQELHAATTKLRARGVLLERLFRGVVEERRDERARVAADLHDDVLQSITRVQQVAATLRTRCADPLMVRDMDDLDEAARYTLTSIRQVMRNLRVSPLGARGLLQTVRSFAREVQMESEVQVLTELPDRVEASPEAQLVVFQVGREAVWNAVKHANPSLVRVAIEQSPRAIELQVTDNGIGFDPEAVDRAVHFGLQLAKERVELLGGHLLVESHSDGGTAVTASVPTGNIEEGS